MQPTPTILEGNSDAEKTAYLGAIASLATADQQASQEEIDNLTQLCQAAGLSEEQQASVIEAASDPSGNGLPQHLDVLKNSELKFSLITDLITFAKSDNHYSDDEKENIQKIAEYLQVDPNQFSLLGEVADKARNAPEGDTATVQQNFLSSSGLRDKLQSAGINSGGLLKGLLSMVAPFILTRMVSRSTGTGSSGSLGGMFGGNGGMFGGSGTGGGMFGGSGGGLLGGGGLGSLIGMLNGGRGYGSTGGLLGKILKGF